MGYYIETGELKLKYLWIEQYMKGKILPKDQILTNKSNDNVPVVVVSNGPFEAAGIAYSEREWEAFNLPDDFRPKKYLLVPKEEIVKQNPKHEGIFEW